MSKVKKNNQTQRLHNLVEQSLLNDMKWKSGGKLKDNIVACRFESHNQLRAPGKRDLVLGIFPIFKLT